ncbi:MAG: hypothetical protein RIB97_13085 [Nitratireductor sp.]
MTDRNDGGPAFPVSKDVVYPQLNGMSLRDWFAGQALNGMGTWSPNGMPGNHKARADWAYEQADAMLKAREVK